MSEPELQSSDLVLFVDEPKAGSLIGGRILVRGWVARRGGDRLDAVDVRLGSRSVRIATGGHRPDVAEVLGDPAAAWSGFEGWIVADESDVGDASRLIVSAEDERGAISRELSVRIWPSTLSVIEVERCDRVADRVAIEGWLLWPDVSPPVRIDILLGDERIERAGANLSRPDVCRGFPAVPRGACRGFRLSVGASDIANDTEPIELRVVATDERGHRLEQRTRVAPGTSESSLDRSRIRSARMEEAIARLCKEVGRELSVLDWESGLGLESRPPSWFVFTPPSGSGSLPYVGGSIDVVALASDEPGRVAEARRVAAIATLEGGVPRRVASPERRRDAPAATLLVHLAHDSTRCDDVLRALGETLPPELRGGILLLDDATTGELPSRIREWARSRDDAQVLRSETPLGFARSANRGAALARGDVVVFLGSDAIPRKAWLRRLLEPLRREPSAVAVGGRVVGRGEEGSGATPSDTAAGGVRDVDPRHGALREVTACTATMLAVRRSAYLQAGGFSRGRGNDGDPAAELCARLGGGSNRVLYQPFAVVDLPPGSEAAVAGPVDPPSGARRASLARLFGWRGSARGRPSRRRALVAAPRMPEFDREAGSRRLFHFVELLREEGWEVSFLALESTEGGRYVQLLRDRGVAVFAGPDSMWAGDEYLDRLEEIVEGRYDIAIVAFWRVAERLLPLFRDRSPETRILVDSVDLHYLREERAALRPGAGPETPAELERRQERRRRELDVYASADSVLAVSEREAHLIETETDGRALTFCVPIPESLPRSRLGFGDRQSLLFMGNFRHRPNLEGLGFLCRAVLPRLGDEFLARYPLTVVGNEVDEQVRALVDHVPHARLVGWVPSVVPYLESARVSLISLLSGAGTKGKLVQALMLGTPSVSTSIGVEGLHLEDERHVLVADEPERFAGAIRRLATDPVLWSRLAREGRHHVLASHGRDVVRERLREAIEATLGGSLGGRRRRLGAAG